MGAAVVGAFGAERLRRDLDTVNLRTQLRLDIRKLCLLIAAVPLSLCHPAHQAVGVFAASLGRHRVVVLPRLKLRLNV